MKNCPPASSLDPTLREDWLVGPEWKHRLENVSLLCLKSAVAPHFTQEKDKVLTIVYKAQHALSPVTASLTLSPTAPPTYSSARLAACFSLGMRATLVLRVFALACPSAKNALSPAFFKLLIVTNCYSGWALSWLNYLKSTPSSLPSAGPIVLTLISPQPLPPSVKQHNTLIYYDLLWSLSVSPTRMQDPQEQGFVFFVHLE